MWTVAERQTQPRGGLRYPSDLTDAEWAAVRTLIPPARRGGRSRTVDLREVLNGILYVLATGCRWRALPEDLPPKSTLHDYMTSWAWDGTLRRLHEVLFVQTDDPAGRRWARNGRRTVAALVNRAMKAGGQRADGKGPRQARLRNRRAKARGGGPSGAPSAQC